MKLFMSFILAIVLFYPINKSYAISFNKSVTASVSPSALVSKYMKTSEFIKLSPRDFSAVTGKKLSFFQRVSLKVLQIKMKHYLKKDPNLTIGDYNSKNGKHRLGVGWIILLSVAALAIILFIVLLVGWSQLQ